MKVDTISPPTEMAAAASDWQMNPRHRILVVDDEPDILRLNEEVLRHHGYEVETAEDGLMAWDAMQLNDYDLLLTDNNMPNVSGLELLQKIHAVQRPLPVILVSGVMPLEELRRQPWLQVEALLLKPYTIEELLTTVKNVLYANGVGAAEPVLPATLPEPAPASRRIPIQFL